MTRRDRKRRPGARLPGKQVARVMPGSPPEPLARFFLDGEEVISEWLDEDFRRHVEGGGIHVAAGTFRPADGRRFLDALALAYSHSSLVHVTNIEPRPAWQGKEPRAERFGWKEGELEIIKQPAPHDSRRDKFVWQQGDVIVTPAAAAPDAGDTQPAKAKGRPKGGT